MPRAFLKGLGLDTREINILANFAIISASDNKKLDGVALSKYKDRIPAAKLHLILDRAICPENLFDDDYDNFIEARTLQLVDAARALM